MRHRGPRWIARSDRLRQPLCQGDRAVTCQGKPVSGSILFSPKGKDASNKGSAVNANLDEDGCFELRLTTIGKHVVVVTPSDIRYPIKPGEMEYPCDRSPQERDINTGDNRIVIELTKRKL